MVLSYKFQIPIRQWKFKAVQIIGILKFNINIKLTIIPSCMIYQVFYRVMLYFEIVFNTYLLPTNSIVLRKFVYCSCRLY